MAMMLISLEDNRLRQKGVTLLELLMVLAILALMAAVTVNTVSTNSPRIAVKLASEQLLADLKRTRLEADARNTPLKLIFSQHGYLIEALSIDRVTPKGVSIEVLESQDPSVIIGPSFWLNGYSIALTKNGSRAVIVVEPVTRRMSVQS